MNPKLAGKPLWIKDPKGNVTTWTYAPEHGGVLTETGPAVNGVTPQKRYFYGQRYARLADSVAGPPVWVLGRRWGSATYYEKDLVGRISKLDQYFNTAPGNNQSTFAYNPAGQIRSETRTSDSYASTGSAAVSRPYSANGRKRPGRSEGVRGH